MDFLNYFDNIEAHMRDRFNAMNAAFDSALQGSANPGTQSYSKTVTRNYNSADGGCGEEVIVERDTESNKEIKTRSRRIGDRAVQEVTTKDLATGHEVVSVARHNMHEADDASFNDAWNAVEHKHIAPARGALRHHDHHHHGQVAQIAEKRD